MRVLWPSFLAAGIAEGVFFTVFDPSELMPFGRPLELSRLGAYSLGYFLFWAMCALASWLTHVLTDAMGERKRDGKA